MPLNLFERIHKDVGNRGATHAALEMRLCGAVKGGLQENWMAALQCRFCSPVWMNLNSYFDFPGNLCLPRQRRVRGFEQANQNDIALRHIRV